MVTWHSFVASCVLLTATQAWAINKCTGPDGKSVFQDRACTGKGEKIEVRPASGYAPAPSTAGSETPQMSEADRLNALSDESRRDRRRWELREHLVPASRAQQARHKYQCEQTQQQLAAQQYRYVQNLYGKTHASQIASEMAANAALCETKSRELKDKAEVLAAECAALDCLRR